MRALTDTEKSYNELLWEIPEIDCYYQTTCERKDENYFNKLFLKALVEHEDEALMEYSKIQEIIAMTKEERAKLLEYDENGELEIQKYNLSEYSKIYILSEYLDIKELLKAEGSSNRFNKLRKFGVSEPEILKIICDEKNGNLQEFILTAQLENDEGELLPVSNLIFNEENVQKLLLLADTCSITMVKNIIAGKYGNLNGKDVELIVLNSRTELLEKVLKDTKLFARQK